MSSLTVERPSRWRPSRVVVIVVVLAMLAMWGYVLYLAFGPGRQAPPDRLADPAFAAEAQARCDAALDEVATLPAASESVTPDDRADVVEQANGIFASMLDDLAAMAPPGEDGQLVAEWVADWRTYLQDRAEYAEAIRSDPEAQLLVSAKDREQITEYLDAFAADNRMIACATPIDV
jgi:hypothetical protein